MKPTKRILSATHSTASQSGTTTIVRIAQATTSPESVLAQARAQTDRFALALLVVLTLASMLVMPLHDTWLWGLGVGPLLVATGLFLQRWRPGSVLTCHAMGVALGFEIGLLDFQTAGEYEVHLVWFFAATALIAYQDWRCLWPATLTLTATMGVTDWTRHPLAWTASTHDCLHLVAMLTQSVLCSGSAAILRNRTLRAAKAAAELDRARRELAMELDQRVRAQHALEVAKERAEAAVRVKGDFLATMSHELRTPMNGILGMSHLLAETELVGEQRDYVDAIVTSGDALLDIINDVLDYSKMEAGRLDIDPMPCDLRRVCEAVMDILAPKADEKNLAFVLRYRPEVPRRVIADAARIRQVLLNLVGNALKFTPAGRVVLDIRMVTSERIRLGVSDTGIGMNRLQQAQLFQPFVQGDAGTTRTYGGTGLGLAISKRLIELMNGTVGVESEPDRGSLFWCELPVVRDAGDATERTVVGLAGHAVVVIDGDDERREALVEMLLAAGLSVTGSTTAPHSIAGLLAVLIDDHIPAVDEMLDSWARSDPAVVRILLTSLISNTSGNPRHEARAGELHLRKPLRADTVLEALIPGGTRRMQPRTPLPQRIITPLPARGAVLLVDDNYVSLRATEIHLQNLGCVVITAVDGVQALQRAHERTFDLIILDLQLADLAAEQMLTALRGGTGPSRQTPVIGMSATASAETVAHLRRSGMTDFITKPVTPTAIEALISSWLK